MSNLIYLVAVGANDSRFYESVGWCVTSLRRWGGFTDDILVVTDNASALRGVINDQANILEVDPELLSDPSHARAERDKYLMARLRVHHHVDLTPYNTVMYVDSDVLAISDVRPLFDRVTEFRYSREFQPMSAPMYNGALSEDELAEAKWVRGINSGIFVCPAADLPTSLDAWKRVLDSEPSADAYDQPALNALVLRKLIPARPMPAFSVAYPLHSDFADHLRPQTPLLHYCGNRRKKFARMKRHFEALESGQPLKTDFGIDEDLELGIDEFGRTGAWIAGDERTGLVIALDAKPGGVESYALINQHYARELRGRGHHVISLEEVSSTRPDVIIHHSFEKDFDRNEVVAGIPHVAIRTSDFGPHPRSWVERINSDYAQLWVHTEWVKDHALQGGVEPERVKVVPHGVDRRIFRPIGEAYPLPTTKNFKFLFVGGTVARKGIDILLKAYRSEFDRDEDVCLVIKGHSQNVFYKDTPFDEQIRKLVDDPLAPEILHLDEHLPSQDLAALYRACTVGVWPYRAEGFLVPALESTACGTPIMVPEIGPTRDFTNHRTSFLLPTLTIRMPIKRNFRMRLGFEVEVDSVNLCEVKPTDLAAQMRQAFQAGRETLKAKAVEGVLLAHGRFTWTHTADHIEACLSDLLGRGP